MKILYLITSADMGGAQKYVLSLAHHFEGMIAAGSERSELFTAAEELRIKTFKLTHVRRRIHPIQDFLAIFEIKNLIQQIRPDIVHLNSSKMGILGSIAGKLSGCKVVYTAHGFAFLEQGPRLKILCLRLMEKMVRPFRSAIIAVSDADARHALQHRLISPQKLTVIHNGIDSINFLAKPEARQKLNLPPDKIIIGSIANLYPNKGLDILLESAAWLNDPRQIFVIIGAGPEMPKLQDQIHRLHLEIKFLLLGTVKNAASMLKAFDIFVLPSRKEGFPFVLLEAMQAGLPIIATDVGGNQEALAGAGLIIPAQNIEKLGSAIRTLSNDAAKTLKLSQDALARSHKFTLAKMLAETKLVYTTLIN
jgi:glycosyltransferase involved in cell wall biosynthesis